MEIVFCDDCGIRIPTHQVTQGVTDDGKIHCEKCRPSAVPLPALTPVGKRPSGDGLPAAQHLNLNPNPQHEFGAAHYTGAGTGPTPPRGHRKTTGPVSRPPANEKSPGRTAPASGENNMMIGLGIGGAFVMLVGLVFMFSGDKTEKKTAQSTATSTAAETTVDASRRTATETSTSTRQAAKVDEPATPLVTTPLAPLTPAVAVPRTESPAAPSPTFAGGGANQNSKTDPDAIAQSAYDKVLQKIAKEEPAGKIAQLELFVKDVDPNTIAASRARAMLSGLKKAEEIAKAPPPPPPPPPPPAAPATPAAPGSSVFKEDFDTTAYGVNFGTVASDLPGGRPGKALKMGVTGDGNNGRGGIYTYSYPVTSPVFKTQTLASTGSGVRLRLKYFITATVLDIVVGYIPEGKEMVICKSTNREPKKGVWTEIDIPLADFKHEAADAKIPDGSRICRLEFWAYGGGDCYVDDVELVAGQ